MALTVRFLRPGRIETQVSFPTLQEAVLTAILGANYAMFQLLAPKDDNRPDRVRRGSGEVRHDDRGNAVWHWAADTARTAIQSASQILRKLDLTGLSIESDQKSDHHEMVLPKTGGMLRSNQAAAGHRRAGAERAQGFDPYASTAGAVKRKPAAARPAPATAHPAGARRPRRSWLQRLLRRD